MKITEPVTMLTDYALGAASLYFAIGLARGLVPKNRTCRKLWLLGFAGIAASAILGGTYHGFAAMLDASMLKALWNTTILSIGASIAFMIAGVMASSIKKSDESRRWLYRGFYVTLAGAAIQWTGFRHGSDFNHNDAFHVIQIAALYLYFRGARLLEDWRGS